MSDYWRQQEIDRRFQENQRQQQANIDLQLWWQRFYQLCDQQRDAMQRQQREWVQESLRQIVNERHGILHAAGLPPQAHKSPRSWDESRESEMQFHQGQPSIEMVNPKLAEYVRAFHAPFSETEEIRELWNVCTETALRFEDARRRFWTEVNRTELPGTLFIQEMLKAAGYEVLGGSRAPMLKMRFEYEAAGLSRLDLRLSIDHIEPKKQILQEDDVPLLIRQNQTMSPENLRFMTHMDNAVRGIDPRTGD